MNNPKIHTGPIPHPGPVPKESLVVRLLKRAQIRRNIPRGEPDRISDILEEAAAEIMQLQATIDHLKARQPDLAVTNAEPELPKLKSDLEANVVLGEGIK